MEYMEWSPVLDEIAQRYWPGALTVVTQLHDEHPFASGVAAPDNTLAFRVSAHPFVAELSEAVGGPIVSTSANIASQGSPYDVESIVTMYAHTEEKPDVIIDAGPLPHESPSTIVKVEGNTLSILRQGEVIIDFSSA